MGDNPCVYFVTVLLCLGSCYYCSNLSLSYFIALLCQVKSLIVGLILDLDYCAETVFLLSRNWVTTSVGKSEKYANLRAWSSDMYATFIQFKHFHLSLLSASENYYERGKYGCRNFHVTKTPLYMLKFLKLLVFYLPMLVTLLLINLFVYKIPFHRKHVRLKFVLNLPLDSLFCFKYYFLRVHH